MGYFAYHHDVENISNIFVNAVAIALVDAGLRGVCPHVILAP